MEILNQFLSGRSGAFVYLAKRNDVLGVYKSNVKNTSGIIELTKKLPFASPEIYDVTESSIFMEYIDGEPIKNVLLNSDNLVVNIITDYICNYIDFSLSSSTGIKDFSDVITDKITYLSSWISENKFHGIPVNNPKTLVHGDFTFDNLIYKNGKIYMIDCSPTDFDSIYYDINKLRQDLTGRWFVRNEQSTLPYKPYCDKIYNNVNAEFPNIFHDATYNLMVARILPYCEKNVYDKEYILNMIK